MKKFYLILLSLAMLCGLCACGGNADAPNGNNSVQPATSERETAMTKEEMLSQSSELDLATIYNDIDENVLRAEDTYVGNVYTYSGYVKEITTEYVQIDTFKIHLSTDELKSLNKGEKITIVGVVESISDTHWVTMSNAYYIGNIYEVSGVIDIAHMTYTTTDFVQHTRKPEEWYCTLTTLDGIEYHLEEDIASEHREEFGKTTIDGVEVKEGDTITISGHIINDDLNSTAKGTFAKGALLVKDITIIHD